jgi:hypothetical protein
MKYTMTKDLVLWGLLLLLLILIFPNFLIHHHIICETNLQHQDDMCSCFSIDIPVLSNSTLLKILKVIYLSLR